MPTKSQSAPGTVDLEVPTHGERLTVFADESGGDVAVKFLTDSHELRVATGTGALLVDAWVPADVHTVRLDFQGAGSALYEFRQDLTRAHVNQPT